MKLLGFKRKLLLATFLWVLLSSILIVTASYAFGGLNSSSANVLGVGRIQSSTLSDSQNSGDNLLQDSTADAAGSSALANPIDSATTSSATAIQTTDETTGQSTGLPSPFPTEPSTATSDAPWQTGWASAYGLDNAGPITYSGQPLTDDSMGVAVPESESYLVGKTIEVKYADQTVRVLINDTGGFGDLGRTLDLQPGVW